MPWVAQFAELKGQLDEMQELWFIIQPQLHVYSIFKYFLIATFVIRGKLLACSAGFDSLLRLTTAREVTGKLVLEMVSKKAY
jgi:hypothetical protein